MPYRLIIPYVKANLGSDVLALGAFTLAAITTGFQIATDFMHPVILALTPDQLQQWVLAWIGGITVLATPLATLYGILAKKIRDAKHDRELSDLQHQLEMAKLQGQLSEIKMLQDAHSTQMTEQGRVISSMALATLPMPSEPAPQKVEIVNTEENPANTHNIQ